MVKKDRTERTDKDSRKTHDLDVDRMVSEGLAGGYVGSDIKRRQIEETHEIKGNNEPFSTVEDQEEK
ncbi:hypothetical protein CEY16_00435 [Halalkalibacillus sediminis]|uniref:DUF4025 domain-containing protein n=1 Tax=Halalkalibacillus sediminis TaxID=2018042 RepID=A0A2I0QVW9_9BACI|nr:hypothetical protein [Halalkalibacillus sediminis]PKR78260.1 hypothetical protein CEY16_00435 [Halalkalibacillus sediminis]